MAASLPNFFILQSGSKYLSLTENVPPGLPSGFLRFDEEQIWSPRVKFAAEPAKSGGGRFVHIRSLYNNKYLVKKQIETKSWIVASAKKPEEDTSKDSCTLFESFSLKGDGPGSVRLRQVQTQNSVTLSASSLDGEAQQGLLASTTSGPVFSVVDRANLAVLPTNIVFISNDDHYYCGSIYLESHNYLRFDSNYDLAEPRAAKHLLPNADGSYCIVDEHFSNQLLTRHGTWIWSDSPQTSVSVDTKFSFVHIENNLFGLRSLGNNNFCGPLTSEGKTNCLNAQYPTLTSRAKLIVEERVLKREIFNIEYRLNDSRIYGEQLIEVDTQTVTNLLNDTATTATLTFSTNKSRTTSWTNSQTISFGVAVSMSVDVIPFISEVGVEMHTDYTSTHEWGESETTETSRETGHTVTVPPLKTYKMSLMATTGLTDVPFNYTQRDLLTTGEWKETKKDDGVFTGINNYNFYYEVVEVKK